MPTPPESDNHVLPVATISCGPAPLLDAVFVTFDVIDGSLQPSQGPSYLMNPAQARELVELLRDALSVLDAPATAARRRAGKQGDESVE